jgi:hypothetical protein
MAMTGVQGSQVQVLRPLETGEPISGDKGKLGDRSVEIGSPKLRSHGSSPSAPPKSLSDRQVSSKSGTSSSSDVSSSSAPPVKPHSFRSEVRDRLLTSKELVGKMGKTPAWDRRQFLFFGKVTKVSNYKQTVNELNAYHKAVSSLKISDNPGTRAQQLVQLNTMLDQVQAKANQYIGAKHTTTQKAVMNDLIAMVDRERLLLTGLVSNPQLDKSSTNMTFGQAVEFARNGVPLSEHTTIGELSDQHIHGKPKVLGAGAFNQVYKVTYDTSTGPVTRVVKPLVSEEPGSRGLVAAKTGIPHENPRYGARNIAISLLNETLGLSVVPKTSYAIHNDRLALAMELAPGSEAREMAMESTGRSLLHNPEFQERLNDLEWLDALGGQGDRHGHNYLVGVDKSGKVTVTGIDNDQSLGKDMLDPDGYIRSSKGQVGGHNVGMPPIISKELAKKLMALEVRDTVGTPKPDPNAALKEKLAKLLTPDELDALQTRLDAIKIKIGTLQTSGHVIDDFATWKKPGDQSKGVIEVLSEAPKREGRSGQQNAPSSYLIRDFGHFVGMGESSAQRMMAIHKLGMM